MYNRSCLTITDRLSNISFEKPPPRYPNGRVLASSAGGPGFNPQSRTASYQIRYNMVLGVTNM